MGRLTDNNNNLTEEDIRPAELMKGQEVALLTDIGRLLSRRDEFVSASCPACQNEEAEHKFTKFGLNYEECISCETMFINPRPSQETLQWFYRGSTNYAYWNAHIFPASEQARRQGVIEPRVNAVIELCDKFEIDGGAILEIGAGFGTFGELMMSHGYFERVVGVEPTPDLAETCRSKGIKVIESTVEELDFAEDQRFDVVVAFEVIEHLFSPRDFIKRCQQFLKPNGLLVITCPNGKGFDLETLGPLSKTIDHEHLNYFNPGSLSLLVENLGLTVVDKVTPGRLDAELVRNEILAGNFALNNQAFLQKVLVDDWDTLGVKFQEFLVDNHLSSSLWIIAQNK